MTAYIQNIKQSRDSILSSCIGMTNRAMELASPDNSSTYSRIRSIRNALLRELELPSSESKMTAAEIECVRVHCENLLLAQESEVRALGYLTNGFVPLAGVRKTAHPEPTAGDRISPEISPDIKARVVESVRRAFNLLSVEAREDMVNSAKRVLSQYATELEANTSLLNPPRIGDVFDKVFRGANVWPGTSEYSLRQILVQNEDAIRAGLGINNN